MHDIKLLLIKFHSFNKFLIRLKSFSFYFHSSDTRIYERFLKNFENSQKLRVH